jgi:hypothetical protein
MGIPYNSIFVWTIHCFLFHFNLLEYRKTLLQRSFNHIFSVMVLKLLGLVGFILFLIWSNFLIKLNILHILILRVLSLFIISKIFLCVNLNLKRINILIFVINWKFNMNSILLWTISYIERWFFINVLCIDACLFICSIFTFFV